MNYVIAAVEHGSFRRTAAFLGVQELAVGRRVRDLEDRLGAPCSRDRRVACNSLKAAIRAARSQGAFSDRNGAG